jgi:hypothetical protein
MSSDRVESTMENEPYKSDIKSGAISHFDEPAILHQRVTIIADVVPVDLTFYMLTRNEIESYAETGNLAGLFLSLFGTAFGATIGFWTALNQGGLSLAGYATLATSMKASIIIGAISLGCAGIFYYRQRKRKIEWLTNTQQNRLQSIENRPD